MKRWAVCKFGDYEADGSRVPKLILYTNNLRVWSRPGLGWCLGQFATGDLTAIKDDADIHVLPDISFDLKLSAIPTTTRQNMLAKLQAAGFSTSGIKLTSSFRELLVDLLKQIQPALDSVEQGDVADVAGQ